MDFKVRWGAAVGATVDFADAAKAFTAKQFIHVMTVKN